MRWKFWKPRQFEPKPHDFDIMMTDPIPQFVHPTEEAFRSWLEHRRRSEIVKSEDK